MSPAIEDPTQLIAELKRSLVSLEQERVLAQAEAEAKVARTREALQPQLTRVREVARYLEAELAQLDLNYFEHGSSHAERAFAGLRMLREGLRGAMLLSDPLEAEINRAPVLDNPRYFRERSFELRREIDRLEAELVREDARIQAAIDRAGVR